MCIMLLMYPQSRSFYNTENVGGGASLDSVDRLITRQQNSYLRLQGLFYNLEKTYSLLEALL